MKDIVKLESLGFGGMAGKWGGVMNFIKMGNIL